MKILRNATRVGWVAGAVTILVPCALFPSVKETEPHREYWTEQDQADYAVQGEYEGSMTVADGTKAKFGVQVIARGGGRFDAVGYRGGLPGAGWVGKKRIRTRDGRTRGDTTEFPGFLGGATIRNQSLTIRNRDGKTVGELKRVTRKSPTLGAKPPGNATVLFDGEVNNFTPGTTTADKLLEFGQDSRHVFSRDFRLHLEFRVPFEPRAGGQGRGNSGVYLQRKYEIQVLDTFGDDENMSHCGGFYSRRPPDINMSFPPDTWQTYDVDFQVARFGEDGEVLSHPVVTVRQNGVVIHDRVELKPRNERDKPPRKGGKLHLQKHDNRRTFYRNIWVITPWTKGAIRS